MEMVPFSQLPLQTPAEVPAVVRGKYLAVSVSILNHIVDTPGIRQAIAYLQRCRPVARTRTFLIYDFSRPLDDEGVEEAERGSWPEQRP